VTNIGLIFFSYQRLQVLKLKSRFISALIRQNSISKMICDRNLKEKYPYLIQIGLGVRAIRTKYDGGGLLDNRDVERESFQS